MAAPTPRHGPTTPADSHPGLPVTWASDGTAQWVERDPDSPWGPGMSPGWPVQGVHHSPPARSGTRSVAWGAVAGAVAAAVGAGAWLVGVGGGTERAALTTTPVAADFRLVVKVLDKQCGDDGCAVDYRVEAGWSRWLDPGRTYEVTYELRGATGPTAVRTLTVRGDDFAAPDRETARTEGRRDRLDAVVTGVEEVR